MTRTTLLGSVAAGLLAAAASSPAWAQATTYPEGTDCSAISDSASRMDCTHQMNESRQQPDTGNVVPDPDGTGNAQPGSPSAPSGTDNPAGNPATNTPGGSSTNGTGTNAPGNGTDSNGTN